VHFRNIACLHLIAVMALTDWELTRDELTMVVAADAHLKQAKSRRTSTTNRLRETLAGLTGLNKDQILTFDRSRAVYRLNQDLFATDVADFDQHLAHAEESTDPEQRAVHLDAALQRYVAPLGEVLDEVWDLVDLRTKYQHRAYQAALDLAALRESEGDLKTAASTLEDATTIFPQEATAWDHLIDLYRRRGDDQAANQAEQRRRQLQQLTAAARGR
jgi:two-component SAPR family response regulator